MRFAFLVSVLALPACSALQVNYEPCTADAQCTEAFGGGWVCGEEAGHCELDQCSDDSHCREAFGRGWGCDLETSLCEAVPADPRCESHPPGILDDLTDHADRILIGSIFDQDDFDLMVKAARLAIIQVTDRDGLGGRDFGIIECTNRPDDVDAPDAEEAYSANTIEAGAYLTDVLGVSTIIGPASSGRTLNAYNDWHQRGTLLISPSATSPELTTADGNTSTDEDPGLLWRTAPPDSLQGEVIAREMIDIVEATNVGVIAQVGAYGDGLADVFKIHFDGDGRTSTKYPFTSSTDLAAETTSAEQAGHDAVLVISSTTADIVSFLDAAATLGDDSAYTTMTIFLPDAARDVEIVDDTRPETRALLFSQIRGTGPSSPAGLAFSNFAADFGQRFSQDPRDFVFSAHAYDAAWLALAGAAWSTHNEGAITGLGTARGLRQISSPSFVAPEGGSSLEIGPGAWTTIQSFFEEGEAINLQGASGSLDYDEDGETTAPMDVWVFNEDYDETVLYCIDVSPEPRADCCTTPPDDGICP